MTIFNSGLRAVYFDLGETLFQPLEVCYTKRNLANTLSESEVSLDADQILGQYQAIRHQQSVAFAKKEFYLHRDFLLTCIQQLFHCLDLAPDRTQTAEFCNRQRDAVVHHLVPQTDCFTTLAWLKQLELHVGIVSNIDNDWLNPLLNKWELATYCDFILSSEDAQSCKPHGGIFEIALAKFNLQPHQVLFVGDSEINDVGGARQLGMPAVLFCPDEIDGHTTQANYCVSSLTDITKLS